MNLQAFFSIRGKLFASFGVTLLLMVVVGVLGVLKVDAVGRDANTIGTDALLAEWEAARPQGRDTGTLRGDLISLIRPWVRRLESRPYAGVIASLITEAHSNPAFAREWRERFVAVRRDPALRLLQRAIERGEIPRNTDVDLVLDLIYGPLYHRLFHGHAPLNERVAVKVVDAALAGILAPAPR